MAHVVSPDFRGCMGLLTSLCGDDAASSSGRGARPVPDAAQHRTDRTATTARQQDRRREQMQLGGVGVGAGVAAQDTEEGGEKLEDCMRANRFRVGSTAAGQVVVALVEVADPGGHLQSVFAFDTIKFVELGLRDFAAIRSVE